MRNCAERKGKEASNSGDTTVVQIPQMLFQLLVVTQDDEWNLDSGCSYHVSQ